ncbi:four helix bundle protein [Aquibium sp. LZ166]|uniref:Four helix bundle protein n=1 Tax=Aquibium pacificus TaxID=3153579 RepID=A0ABV3SIG5_9HYPH
MEAAASTRERDGRTYRDLLVWEHAIELAVACFGATKALPQGELYGLTSQIRRAAASIPANIAEGYGRDSRASFVQFLRIAQGSLKELETHLIRAGRLDYVSTSVSESLLGRADEVGKMLRGLIRSLQRKD